MFDVISIEDTKVLLVVLYVQPLNGIDVWKLNSIALGELVLVHEKAFTCLVRNQLRCHR